jgi:hypothetical protein
LKRLDQEAAGAALPDAAPLDVVVVVPPLGLLAGGLSPPQAMTLAMAVATARTARIVSFFIWKSS